MAQHVPLYKLQRSMGHDPQREIDNRASMNIRRCMQDPEPTSRIQRIEQAIIFADDILNCSEPYKTNLSHALAKYWSTTSELTQKIINIADSHDLLECEQNLKFQQEVTRKLNLGNNWDVVIFIRGLKKMIQKAAAAERN